jgi:hypothetical protein
MYLLCHLAAGLAIGVILYLYFRDPLLIIAAGAGGIASDLIDKPLGHILLKNSLDYGRIYAHGLVFLSIVLLCGIIIWYRYRSFTGIAFAFGIFSHQLLDRMWDEPVNWYYPFLGPYTQESFTDFFGNAFFQEIFNPSEWLFASAILVILILSLNVCKIKKYPRYHRIFLNLAGFIASIIGLTGVLLLYPGKETLGKLITGLGHVIDIHLTGGIMLLTAFITGLGMIKIWGKK